MEILKQYETNDYSLSIVRTASQTEVIVSTYQMSMEEFNIMKNHNLPLNTGDSIPKQYTKDVRLNENFSFNISVRKSY